MCAVFSEMLCSSVVVDCIHGSIIKHLVAPGVLKVVMSLVSLRGLSSAVADA